MFFAKLLVYVVLYNIYLSLTKYFSNYISIAMYKFDAVGFLLKNSLFMHVAFLIGTKGLFQKDPFHRSLLLL
jgi:hypothetical protein